MDLAMTHDTPTGDVFVIGAIEGKLQLLMIRDGQVHECGPEDEWLPLPDVTG